MANVFKIYLYNLQKKKIEKLSKKFQLKRTKYHVTSSSESSQFGR